MTELVAPEYARIIAQGLNVRLAQVNTALRLFAEGNTVPFVARYRKEMTGELDENQLRAIADQFAAIEHLYQRKAEVLRLLAEQGVLEQAGVGDALSEAIVAATTLTEIDDLYRPWRPKRKTRASVAREKGLAPLADLLRQTASGPGAQAPDDALSEAGAIRCAASYVSVERGVATALEALQGAADIVAEEVADDAAVRAWVRTLTRSRGVLRCTAVDAAAESVYTPYYDYHEALVKLPPHRILAINRGEREGLLKVGVTAPQEEIERRLARQMAGSAATWVGGYLHAAATDAYRRLISPSIERELRAELTEMAEQQAIHIFGENLRQLLLQSPLRNHKVLGVDPAFRTGCKLAVVDDTGKLLEVAVIYPTPPQNRVAAARDEVLRLLQLHSVTLIAIGNGTASRETENFIVACTHELAKETGLTVPYVMVSEAGASVYSASPLAGEEFPELDVSERSAVSIARRLQDPLAELVKIDPKSVGVGQYQHDVSQKRLDARLAAVVESAVNQVGIDVNTASVSLLSYVAGLSKTAAKNIVAYRIQNGRFTSRKGLAKVPRLGPKTLEQCVGFLRITGGDQVLDATSIHPETYAVVGALFAYTGERPEVLEQTDRRLVWLQQVRQTPVAKLSAAIGIGEPTLCDILDALQRPGRDPREDVPPPILRTDILKLEDLSVGVELTGTVRNVVDFGAFVDVGLKNDGLVHISELASRFVKHPLEVVAVGDVVNVRVLAIDSQKHRLALTMKR